MLQRIGICCFCFWYVVVGILNLFGKQFFSPAAEDVVDFRNRDFRAQISNIDADQSPALLAVIV